MKSEEEIFLKDGKNHSPDLSEAETALDHVEARTGLCRDVENEAKLEALRSKLQASKRSQLIADFDPHKFLIELRHKPR